MDANFMCFKQVAARNRTSVLVPRAVLTFIVSSAILFPSLYQHLLNELYIFLYGSQLYNFSGFETLETVLCYMIIEPLYTVKFVRNPSMRIDVRPAKPDEQSPFSPSNPRRPKMLRLSRRLGEITTYVFPLVILDLTMVKKFADVSVESIRVSGGYERLTSGTGLVSKSFLLPTFHNFSLHSPVQLYRALPDCAPTSRRLVLELIVSFFIYDTLFFLIHLAFHRFPVLWRIHGPHHKHGEINPQVTNRLSVAERLSLIMLANFSLNIIRSHVLTRTAFVPFFVYLLVEVHCGLDLDWGYDKILPFGWGVGSAKHAVHHRTGDGSYQAFFTWWDNSLESIKEKNILSKA